MTFAARPRIDVIDLSNPAAPALAFRIDLTPWGSDAHATSVAVREGVVAIAVPQGAEDTAPGKVLFFDAAGVPLSEVTVGALPDMLTFTPNGRFVLTANEGQPLGDYSFDPEGSVSLIDMTGGAASLTDEDVTTADFHAFNGVALDPSIRILAPAPPWRRISSRRYITVSQDSATAWVTLQENNALALIDLKENRVTRLVGLGFKDHSIEGAGLDGGRDDGANRILPWQVRGMYLPDAIASFRHGNETLLVTANEGDVREYAGLNAAGTEVVEIEDIALDPVAFPAALATTMKSRPNGIGRLKVSAFDGDTDGDGDYDELYSYGGRSFSIRSADGQLVFDSGDLLEQITAAALPTRFNASNTNNTRDDCSDDKGPEPEGVTVASLFGAPVPVRDAGAHRRGRGVRTDEPGGAAFRAVRQYPRLLRGDQHRGGRRPRPGSGTCGPGGAQPHRRAAAARLQRGERLAEGVRHQRLAVTRGFAADRAPPRVGRGPPGPPLAPRGARRYADDTPVSRVLILFAHPALERSRVHRALLRAVPALDGVTLHDLYEAYPDFDIDVPREQALLRRPRPDRLPAPVLLVQHAGARQAVGGPGARARLGLRRAAARRCGGKRWLHVISAGGREAAYQHEGYNRFTMRELLAPLEQTARLCGMTWLPPYVVHGTHRLDEARDRAGRGRLPAAARARCATAGSISTRARGARR